MLRELVERLCGKGANKLFRNREVMIQALLSIPADHLQTKDMDEYSTVDEIITGIRLYLGRYHSGITISKDKDLHKAMIMNLTKTGQDGTDILNVRSDKGSINYLTFDMDQSLKANASHLINGERVIPLYWRRMCKDAENAQILCDRMAWILQYLEVYYYSDTRMAERRENPTTKNGYISYYAINTHMSKLLKEEMQDIYSDCGLSYDVGDLSDYHQLAKELMNMIRTSYEIRKGKREVIVAFPNDNLQSLKECKRMCEEAGKLLDRVSNGENIDYEIIYNIYRNAFSCISSEKPSIYYRHK
ncbi:MAG: hypothetical protein J6O73_04070 [Lachnospiraceae bacterium]|nr:hypothetical protein [Lachnospiraceae bacterium]